MCNGCGKGEPHLVLFQPALHDQGRDERKDEAKSFTELLLCSWRRLQHPCPFLAGTNSGAHNRLLACVGAAVSQNIPKLKHSCLSCLGTWLVKMQSSREIIQAPHRKGRINLSCCKEEAKGITLPQTNILEQQQSQMEGNEVIPQFPCCFEPWLRTLTLLPVAKSQTGVRITLTWGVICQVQLFALASAWRSKMQCGHKPARR